MEKEALKESTILIVEDDENIRYILQNQLISENYNVLTSSSLKDTLDLLKKINVDLIIIDYHLVDIRGTDIIKKVKEFYPFIKFILLSGRIDKHNIEAIVDNVDDFVLKPYELNDILLRIFVQLQNKKKIEKKFNELSFDKRKLDNIKHNVNILIADDDSDITHILKIHYNAKNINVITANSLTEAKLIINNPKFKFDVAVIDIVFPDGHKGGFELISKLKTINNDCRIIVYTGSNISDYEITKSGVDIIFRKPLKPYTLLSNLNGVVRTKVLENQLQYNLYIQTKLNEFSNALKTFDLWSVRDVVEKTINEIFKPDYYFFLLLEKDSYDLGYFYVHSNKRISDNKNDFLITIKDENISSIIKNKRVVIKKDEFLMLSNSFKNIKFRHYIFYPVKYAIKVTGLLFLGSKSKYFTQKDFYNIETFSDIMSRQIEIVNEHFDEKEKSHTAGKLSVTDELTNVYNTRFFLNHIKKVFKDAKKFDRVFSLLIIDIDFFKKFNDTYGHKTGDLVLQKICEILKESVRGKKDIIARYGGEEFCVILPNIPYDKLFTIAERIRKNVEDYVLNTGENKLNVTISIGGVSFSNKFSDSDEMFKIADANLYKAKETGRNKVVL